MAASYRTPSGKALSVGAPGLLTNGESYGAIPVVSTKPAHGTVSITSDGAFTYTPTAGFTGTDSFKYSETNGHGTSKATVTIHVTPTVPGAPPKPTVTPGNGSVKVTWTAPTDGGSTISHYTVTASGTGTGTGKTCTTTGTTSCTVTGLTNGTAYTFTVVAKNAVGPGSSSPASTPVTPATVPGAPRTLAASASALSITVTWAAPRSSGGTRIRSYEVFRGTTSGTVGARPLATVGPTTLEFTDTSAAAGVLYYYEVVATNGVGMSAYSIEISDSLLSIGALGDRMAGTATGSGYWIVTATGDVTAYGPAQSYGSISSLGLTVHDIVGIAPTPTGKGYWLVGADGGVFSFGDARFYGSMGGKALNQPVVGMAAVPTGNGYWMVAADGGVFSFGSAQYYGSMGGKALNQPITAMTASPTSGGYWLVAADGGVFSFGSARFFGSTASKPPPAAVIGLVSPPAGTSYSEVDQAGVSYQFGG